MAVNALAERAPGRDWPSATVPRWTVVPLRLYLAGGFVLGTVSRLTNWPGWDQEVRGFLTVYLPAAAPFYRPLMQYALGHSELFARLVYVGEGVVGLSLLLGLATRLGAALGMFLSLNYLLSKGNTPWSVNNDAAFLAGMLIIAITRAGRTAGVDAMLARRFPHSRLW